MIDNIRYIIYDICERPGGSSNHPFGDHPLGRMLKDPYLGRHTLVPLAGKR